MWINPVDKASYARIIRGQNSHKSGRDLRINWGLSRICRGGARICRGKPAWNVLIFKRKLVSLAFAFRGTFTSMLLVEGLALVDNLRLPTCRSPATTTKIENL